MIVGVGCLGQGMGEWMLVYCSLSTVNHNNAISSVCRISYK